ncbi:hypothetical protein JAAARDRAFT_200063 [Jaapia argillacea MUCL 33604]|uniref:Uncharacterized protein n=1 Tax=Jaapia argillacea MUCL 33604 TaxID=933084 RepID=A0A067P6I3_9AGAM|nr:hypothetical protein JAAARDRAFT_200063 [Jaapia argillacea MUCL 33604]
MTQNMIRLPFLVIAEVLEGYNHWVRENHDVWDWIEKFDGLQYDQVLARRARSLHQDSLVYWTVLPDILGGLGDVLQTFQVINQSILEANPASQYHTNLDLHEALLVTLVGATSREQLNSVWLSFRGLALSFCLRLLECYTEATRRLRQHAKVVSAHKLAEMEVQLPPNATSYVRAVVDALLCLTKDTQFINRDYWGCLKFKSFVEISINLCD